jgi:hypothetical protein
MRFFTKSFLLMLTVTALFGCSDNKSSSSSLVKVKGWVGAQDYDNAQVIANQIAESGQISVEEDIYLGDRLSTDSKSYFTAQVNSDEVLMFIARGQIANVDVDLDNKATTRQCQLAEGCLVTDLSDGNNTTTNYMFGEYYPETSGFEWRGVVYTANKGSINNINPITSLAAAYAYQFDVLNYSNDPTTDPALIQLAENEIFTAYDVVLANSQVSNLLGIGDIIGEIPANLTKLNSFNSNTLEVRNQIRYGALIAAIQEKELAYRVTKMPADSDYVSGLMEEFAKDAGQLYYKTDTETRLLTLVELYKTAYKNLEKIVVNIKNAQAKIATEQVIRSLRIQTIESASENVDTKTAIKPDSLSSLLTATEKADFDLGLEKTKLFVNSLLNIEDVFWQEGYKAELDTYLDFLTTLRDTHQTNMNEVIDEFKHIQDYYVTCILGGAECAARFSDLESRKVSFNNSTKVLVLNNGQGGEITVSQAIADLNLLDNNDSPSVSNAIDVYITGSIEKNGLVLELEHDYATDSSTSDSTATVEEDVIEVPSSMRIYYSQEVSEIDPSLEIEGYELIWGEFNLYDKTAIDTSNETELNGAFRIFYRGIYDPQDPENSDLRFNIEDWVLTLTISDNVDDVNGVDSKQTNLSITGASSNAAEFYPDKKFSSFNGFFESNQDNVPIGSTESGLIKYVQGTESVPAGSLVIEVKTVDFINSLGQDIRYRFYPNEQAEDQFDINNNGKFNDMIDLHRIEECELDDAGLVQSCGPKTKIYSKRDVQDTINELWKVGLFQRVSVAGVGTYAVDYPTSVDAQGCYSLNTLETEKVLDGTLLEPQVLGLSILNLYAEVNLIDDQNQLLPSTLVNISVVAPSKDTYQVSAALSHNYTSSDPDDTGLILGSGSEASVLAISYDTSSDFKDMGNITVSKSGVILTELEGTPVEDQDITAFLTQTYDPNSVQYKIIESAEGVAERCVLGTDSYVKDPADAKQVFYINYRGVIYATARPEGNNDVWTIRYLDGSWMIPGDGSSTTPTTGTGW